MIRIEKLMLEEPNKSDQIAEFLAVLELNAKQSWKDAVVDANDALPPAEPKRGKWIRNDNGTYSCSLCQAWIPEEQHHYARYCLHCGTDMRGDKE